MRGRRLVCACAGVLALAAWCAPPLAAAGDPSRPAPERLWRSYPLDSARTSDASQPRPSPARARPDAQPLASTGSSQTALWLVVAAALAAVFAALAAVVLMLTRRGRGFAVRLPEWRALIPSAELRGAWFGFVDGMRSLGAMLREEAGSLTGPLVEFATPAGPDPSGRRPEGDPKAQRAAVKRLKEKRRTADRDEVDLLKAKLMGTRRRRPAAPARPRTAQIRAVAPAEQRCRIGWWRGYVKSEFYAQEQGPETGGAIVATSASFRWSKPTPPPATLPHVARAHAALVAHLKTAGWEMSGHGEHWFELELQRRPDGDPGAEREP